MGDAELHQRVEAVRRFSRFYTKVMGVLHEGLLGSPYSLTEVRVLYEIAHASATTATALGRELGLDAGYLSRIVRKLEEGGLIRRRRSETDGRQSVIVLTDAGRRSFARFDAQSNAEVRALLDKVAGPDQIRLVRAMGTVEAILGGAPSRQAPYGLRHHRPGDIGWVIHRHGALYAQEYGWDETFEALVARICAEFIADFDAERERCWIAERDGEMVGSVFLVKGAEEEAKLRLLLVEPKARGLGIGRRLVEECIHFAQAKGYRRISLWTNDVLVAARHIYQQTGFRLVKEEPHHSFGHDLVGQTWELTL